MTEFVDTQPNIDVQESEYHRLLGYPRGHVASDRALELAQQAREWYSLHGRPWAYGRRIDGIELLEGQVTLGGAVFTSKELREQFGEGRAFGAMVVAVSAGPECEQRAKELWLEGKPDEYYFMEMYGSAVVEHLIAGVSGRVCGWAEGQGIAVLPHNSPGYTGWDIADQNRLWELIRDPNILQLSRDLRVLESGMLKPKKSLLAVFGLSMDAERVRRFARLVPCEGCLLPGCDYRRVPYKHRPTEQDLTEQTEETEAAQTNGSSLSASVLDHRAKYSVNRKALEKWAQERLQLEILQDGSVEANFRYEGTTCSNLGQPLEFHYRVTLGPPEQEYRILEQSCAPAPGDTGHTLMCEYLADAPGLMASFQKEKPLLGCPLDDVVEWERSYSPSGCFCDAERRTHKWGLVLEVLHYALVQREKARSGDRQPENLLR